MSTPYRRWLLVFLLLAVWGFSATASAQPWRYRFRRPAVVGGFGTDSGYHASTALEGALVGRAAAISAVGRALRHAAVAAETLEDAKAKNLANRKLGVQTYWQIREVYEQEASRRRRLVPNLDKIGRMNAWSHSKRPTLIQMDPISGTIAWPKVFQGTEFAQRTNALEELFRTRTVSNSGPGSPLAEEVARLTEDLRATLREKTTQGTVTCQEHRLAKGLLNALKEEARFPPPRNREARLSD